MSDLSNSHSNPSTRPNRPTAPNLLSLQGKLLVLQDELDALDAKAASSPDPDLHSSMGSWEALMRNAKVSHNHSGKEETKRLEIAGGLEVKLKRYREFARVQNFPPINSAWMHLQEDSYQEIEERTVLTKADGMDLDKALIHSKEAMKLESPDERMSEAHRCVLKDVASGEQIKLVGAEDLVALKPPADQDIVSRTLRSHWPFPSTALASREPGEIQFFHERCLVRVLKGISILIPILLIVGPILALNFTSSPNARLGIAIAFIVLFGTGLGLSTGVSRDTIFVATATYSAVLVVYVSGNLGDVGSTGSALESSRNATA